MFFCCKLFGILGICFGRYREALEYNVCCAQIRAWRFGKCLRTVK